MRGIFWGLVTIDLHFFADHFPDENSKTKVKKFDAYIGGPATNAAITFQHLGAKAQLVTAVGKNSFRSMIYDRINHFDIDTFDIKEHEQSDPVFASVLTNESTGSRTIYTYNPAAGKNTTGFYSEQNFDIALFDGFYIESAIQKAKECKSKGVTTIMDGGSWKSGSDELLKYIDIAICSEDFLPPGVVDTEDVLAYLLDKGVSKAAITRGEKSIIANEGEVNVLVKVPKVKVIDTSGAGDIFHGAFCYYYALGNDFQVSLQRASEIAGTSCKYRGPRTWMQQA